MNDSLFDIFKTKAFWLVILIGSMLGALVSISLSFFEKEPVIIGHAYVCPENKDFKKVLPVIINVEDSLAMSDFANLMSGQSNKARFRSILLPIGTEVPIIAVDSIKGLTKVFSYKENQEAWLFSKDLKNEACLD